MNFLDELERLFSILLVLLIYLVHFELLPLEELSVLFQLLFELVDLCLLLAKVDGGLLFVVTFFGFNLVAQNRDTLLNFVTLLFLYQDLL